MRNLSLLVLAVFSFLNVSPLIAEVTPPRGFTALFNGEDLEGWRAMPHFDPRKLAAMSEEDRGKQLDVWMEDAKRHWSIQNGELVNDGKGAYLTTDKEYGDIELLIDYKTAAKGDSGIYLRTTPQVQIWDYSQEGGKWNRGADLGSGSLFNNNFASRARNPLTLADKPFGEWNRFRILQVGELTSVWLNEQLVVDRQAMENYWDRGRPLRTNGRIQLQTHGGEIRWRNLFIREIATEEATAILRGAAANGFETIFNGKDFEGWAGPIDNYEIREGTLMCKPGKGGTIYTDQEYADFIVRLEFKLPPHGNNGLAIRYPGKGNTAYIGMCELQVLDSEHAGYAKLDKRQYHGSAYGMAPAHRGFLRPTGEWNYQQVTVIGSTIKVELNGYAILDTDLSKITNYMANSPHPGKDRTSGHFGFAGHSDPVQFRNISIKRLNLDGYLEKNLAEWPQFRGHNSSGRAVPRTKLPTKIGPEQNVVWKTKLPPGHSSPVVFGDHIYLQAIRGDELLTICLDRASGEMLWEKNAPHKELESVHNTGSHAQCTPATDGKYVVCLFGSSGLFCYDTEGNLQWQKPMGPFNNEFGAGTSPIIVNDRVILVQDHDTDSFLTAIDKETGETIWKTDRSEFPRNYCSPIIWNVDEKKQIVVAATLRVVGYDFETGKEIWTVRGLARSVCMTPVIGVDNNLYVAGWSQGGGESKRISVAVFDEFIKGKDANKNGTIERDELSKGGDIERRYPQVDRDKSGSVTKEEFEYYRNLFDAARNVVMKIKPGGKGELTDSNVAWRFKKFVPFCSSPLYYNGYVFTAKDGGIFTSLNARTGEALRTNRLADAGKYYSSPVAGDAKIYVFSQRGVLTVVSPWAEWKTLHTAEFGEDVYATPAIAGGRIYVRTMGHLYCFGGS